MTLKDKFQEWHDAPTNETVAENIVDLEKIANELAIEFGEWLMKKGRYNITNWSKTTEELLETFKKEKGL